jgi:hypothetical protein
MDHNDLKLMLLNTATIALSFSAIENFLKFILLVASIVYTVQRSHDLYKKNKKEED